MTQQLLNSNICLIKEFKAKFINVFIKLMFVNFLNSDSKRRNLSLESSITRIKKYSELAAWPFNDK